MKMFPRLILTYFALLILLALSAGSALLDLGAANTFINLGIAAAKSALIAVFFMHALRSGMHVRLSIVVIFLWIGMLFLIPLGDYLTR